MKFQGTLTPIESSNLNAVGLDKSSPETPVLQVQFRNGRKYNYWPVSQDIYRGLINAPSAFQYFNSHIKNNPNIKFKEVHENH